MARRVSDKPPARPAALLMEPCPGAVELHPQVNSMASQTYEKVSKLIAPYIGADNASAALSRQLARCGATELNFSPDQLKEVLPFIIGATTIYLAGDKTKQAELTVKLKALV